MPTVRKSVIVQHPASAMFDLVDGVERYPEFLPWCAGAAVIERTPAVTEARVEVDFHGLRSAFTTRNSKESPEWMHLAFVEGPFERFQGHWRFVALGESGCRVEFALDYGFDSRALDTLLGPVFGHILETLVERFVQRADEVMQP
ncbi:ubiquinone-binding protein [Betaproteobacteria bacterium GR16-43]|nr:ubiquinone-binding protein [Betaproteobacteria bacterium GR16-43]